MNNPNRRRGRPKGAKGASALNFYSQMHDAILVLRQCDTLDTLASKLGVRPKKAYELIRLAFENDLVSVPLRPSNSEKRLSELFSGVQFKVLAVRRMFERLAAIHLLTWLQEIDKNVADRWVDSGLYIAVGGGQAMNGIGSTIGEVVRERPNTANWLEQRRGKIQFLNATAGGQPLMPQYESSFLAVQFAHEMNEQQVGVFSVSPTISREEQGLIKNAIKNPCVVISGIGVPGKGEKDGAYCLRAVLEKDVLQRDQVNTLLGEFLFHLLTKDGQLLWDADRSPQVQKNRQLFDVKEQSGPNPGNQQNAPMFASLFAWDGLKRNVTNTSLEKECPPRYVIAVTKDDENNREQKAKAMLVLLRQKMLTHAIVSSDLASALIAMAG